MPDGRHDWNPRCRNRPYDWLLVKAPQVFQATASATNDEHFGRWFEPIGKVDPLRDFQRGAFTLDARRNHQDFDAREAAA